MHLREVNELVDRLRRNQRFYQHEADALKEDESRRDNRHMGWREAQTISDLFAEAVRGMETSGKT